MNTPSLCIKMNNCASNEPCAVCGTRTDPLVGPEIFIEGTWAIVCDACASKYAPHLLAAIRKAPRGPGHE